MSKVKVLLTGATGLIGFAILKEALKEGHDVTFTARSEEKAKEISSNPVIQKLNPGNRLTSIIVPDITVDGAFTKALHGITHILHVGSPVPKPYFSDFRKEVYEPTVRSMETLLQSAAETGIVQRIVITSSFYYYFDADMDPSKPLKATERMPLPEIPTTFTDVGQAYILAKRAETYATEEWLKRNNPQFAVYRIPLGWVFGQDDRWLTKDDMATNISTNHQIIPAFTGATNEFPLGSLACHIDDVVTVHLGALLKDLPQDGVKDFGVSREVDWSKTWEYAARGFPEAVEKGLIKEGKLTNMSLKCDCSETERTFDLKPKDYEQMVKDVVGQYLELTSKA